MSDAQAIETMREDRQYGENAIEAKKQLFFVHRQDCGFVESTEPKSNAGRRKQSHRQRCASDGPHASTYIIGAYDLAEIHGRL